MKIQTAKLAALALFVAPVLFLATGCESQGPAERAGENIDQGVENAKDALDPRGPTEKAGAAVDDAINE